MQTPRREHDDGGGGLSGSPTPTRDNSTLLREQEAERERLRMDNFNQALRINFLEERLLRVKQGTDFSGEDLESELAQLRITLEERDHELRQRNFSMIRATEAIDLLTAQLHEAQAAAARAKEDAQREAEEQMHQHLQQRGGVDAETAERWRAELANAAQKEQLSAQRVQELEQQMESLRLGAEQLKMQMKEMQMQRDREQQEMKMTVQRDQQNLQQLELTNVKLSTEVEHWKALAKQREEQLTALQLQMESLKQEMQKNETQSKTKLKNMEGQLQHTFEQLQRESETYRSEQNRLLTDREKWLFEKDRVAIEMDSIKQDRVRLQSEMERMAKEMQQMAGEFKRAQLQNAKLTATCEEQNKSLESFKVDRESSMDTIHQLESELHQNHKRVSEYEMSIKTLESRLQYAEAEAQRMKEQCDLAESRCQQTSNERLLMLEKERQAIEEDNRRLRSELAGFQHDLEAMEQKFRESEKRLSSEAAHASEQRLHLSAYEDELEQQAATAREYQSQLAACEEELARRDARVQELEQQAAVANQYQSQLTVSQNELARRGSRMQELEDLAAKAQRYQSQLAACEEELARRGTRVQDLEQQAAAAKEYQSQLAVSQNELSRRGSRMQELEDVAAKAQKYQNQLADCEDELARQRLRIQELDDAAAKAQKYQNQLTACESELARRDIRLHELEEMATNAQKYRSQLSACEDELDRRGANVQELERKLTEVITANSSNTSAARQQQMEWQHQLATEKNGIVKQLETERRRAIEMEETASTLKKENASAKRELGDVEKELRSILMSCSRAYSDVRDHTVVGLAREAIAALKSDFKAETEELQAQWKHQASLMGSKLDRLATQLRSSQGKLEVLQRSSFHIKDTKQSVDKTWSVRYEELRVEKEHERRELEEEIQYFQTKATEAEEALRRTRTKLETRDRKSPRNTSQRDNEDLKESNRLLFEEVQERRRSAEHARKQYMQAIRENKELLKAVEIYKDGISGRDKEIEKYKARLIKYSQQLQQRTSFGKVKQTLLEQLEQTQYMISETYKRWEDSPIVRGPAGVPSGRVESFEAAIVQLDEYIGRMQLVSERWGDFMKHSEELQRRYGDAWKSAASQRPKEQPRWAEDVERKCSRLLTEAVRVSEAMHDVVDNIAGVLQRERDEKKRLEKERVVAVDNNAPVKRREDLGLFDDRYNAPHSRSASQPQGESPVKARLLNGTRQGTKALASGRRSASDLYRNSLSSLGRVGMKVQDLEKEIRNARD